MVVAFFLLFFKINFCILISLLPIDYIALQQGQRRLQAVQLCVRWLQKFNENLIWIALSSARCIFNSTISFECSIGKVYFNFIGWRKKSSCVSFDTIVFTAAARSDFFPLLILHNIKTSDNMNFTNETT